MKNLELRTTYKHRSDDKTFYYYSNIAVSK